MRVPKKQTTPRVRKPKIIQELQPNKICKCGACVPVKPRVVDGKRRLKIGYKWVNYNQTPVLSLQGEWFRDLGFDIQDYVIVTEGRNRLIVELEEE